MIYKIKYQLNNQIKIIKIDANSLDALKLNKRYPSNILDIKCLKPFKIIDFFKQEINIKGQRKDTKNIYELFQSLNMMLKSSLSISQSIELLLDNTNHNKNTIQKDILTSIKHSLTSSKSISQTLGSHTNYLDNTTILFLELGLKNGNIKESINSIVTILKEDLDTKKQIMQAVRYPIILVISLILSLFMIFSYVLPNFEFVFTNLKDDIPLSTELLLKSRDFITNNFEYIIGIGLGFTFILIVTIKKYKYYFDRFIILHIPLFSSTLKNYYMFKLFLSLGIIVNSKYQFQIAINNSKDIISNLYIKSILTNIIQNIQNGSTIAQAFDMSKLFNNFTIKLLYVAQETSSYSKVLNELTIYHKEKFKSYITNLSAILEPILVLFITVVVLWLILAIMSPIWQMNATLN